MENGFEKRAIAAPLLFSFDLINAPGRPCDHGRIDVAKMPLVCRDLAVRMLVPFARNEIELTFRKMRIDQRKRDAVKGEIPRGVPREFPFVRHRHHTLVIKMTPAGVAPVFTFLRRRWEAGIALEPLLHDVMVKLLGPKQSGQRLALDRAMLFA